VSEGACAADLAAPHPPVSRRWPRHLTGRARGDRAPGAHRAGPFGHRPDRGRPRCLDRGSGTEQATTRPGRRPPRAPDAGRHAPRTQAAARGELQPWAGFGPCTVKSFFLFLFKLNNSRNYFKLPKFVKLVRMSKIFEINFT
jgi:hypothetical protein